MGGWSSRSACNKGGEAPHSSTFLLKYQVQPKAKSHSQYPKGKMERTRNPRDVELAGVEVEGKLKDVVEETSGEALIRKKMIKDAYDDKDNEDDENPHQRRCKLICKSSLSAGYHVLSKLRRKKQQA